MVLLRLPVLFLTRRSLHLTVMALQTNSPALNELANQILNLKMMEAVELRTILQEKLKLTDAMLSPLAAPAAAAGQQTEETFDDQPVAKTSFTVHLKSFEDGKKVPLIKEIKNIIPDMNLIQAKKYIESLPHVVIENVGKDEADQIMKKLEQLGGICTIE